MSCLNIAKTKYFNKFFRSYSTPLTPSDDALLEASRNISVGVISCLKSSSFSPIYISMRLDVWRYVVCGRGTESNHRGHLMLERDDLSRLKFLPTNWWYCVHESGMGNAIDFPIKVRYLYQLDKGD